MRIMLLAVLILGVTQATACPKEATVALQQSVALARAFDLPGAAQRQEQPPLRDCVQAQVAALYLRALQSAREAYRTGGDAVSLQPVTLAIATLERHSESGERHAELTRVILMAAAAAAQSERGDMALLLDHATALERRMVRDGDGGAPGVTAHEAAGDLWLQVHRFESAVGAYVAAAQLFGNTPRITLGLARTAVQMKQREPACRAYRMLITDWTGSSSAPEIIEARTFVAGQCQPAG
jgi:hypothetical protein